MSRLLYVPDPDESVTDKKFFIPDEFLGEMDSEAFYKDLMRKYSISSMKRIFSICLTTSKGNSYCEAIGEKSPENGRVVVAIFQTNTGFRTITASSGLQGVEYFSMYSNPTTVTYFRQ